MASGVVGGQQSQDQPDQATTPRITAHRGFRDVYPQNTVAAMSGSSAFDVDRIEIDVVATSDGEIVSFHDAELDGLTDQTGAVGETPAEAVLDAEVLGSGETIPTLSETLAAVDPDITMNIEFKENGPLSWTAFGEQALAIAEGYPGEYYVSSFDPDALRAVREIDPAVDVAPIFFQNRAENLELARELDAEAVNVYYGLLDAEFVETVQNEGREVNTWTVDNWREARGPLALGVDGLIADQPYMNVQTAQPNPRVRVDSIAVGDGTTATARVDARFLYDGLSGGQIVLSLTDPAVATITDATAADVFGLSETAIVDDGSSAVVRFTDLERGVQETPGITEIHLADVSVEGEAAGTTDIEISVDQFDDETGATPTVDTRREVAVTGPPPVVAGAAPTDPDNDGLYEDLNGNGRLDYDDIVVLFEQFDSDAVRMHVDAYDFNENEQIDFDDIVTLYDDVN